MNKKFTKIDLLALFIFLVPWIYTLYIYPSLPASVPVHFGPNGKPDRYGSPAEFMTGIIVISIITLFTYVLLRFLPAIDPKKTAKYSMGTFNKIGIALVLLMSMINVTITYSTIHEGMAIEKFLFPALGLFFAFMGNVMHSIKPNYFAGIRTPWTLESEDNWRATHMLAGKLWFAGGIIAAVVCAFLPAVAATIFFLSVIGVITVIPLVYSFLYFKKHKNKP